MDSNNDKFKNTASMHKCHMAARNLFTEKKKLENFLEKSQENGQLAKKIQDFLKRARLLGRKTRQEIGKGNQMTALRFQTGG